MAAAEPVTIERLRVESGRLVLDVRLGLGAPRRTDARLAKATEQLRPALPHHVCINGRGPAFAAVLADTPLPHLLEHLIIDAQVADPRTPADQRFVGATRWIDEAAGTARIEVSFRDDLVALRAVRDAQAALSDILERYGSDRRAAGEGGGAPAA